MPNQVKTLLAPLGGIDRRSGFQKQPPFTCVNVEDFWPINYQTGRSVMCTRPLRRVLETPAGGAPGLIVNMMEKINGVSSAGHPAESVICAENGTVYFWNGTGWTVSGGAQAGAVATSGYVGAKTMLQKALIASSGKPLVYDYVANTTTTMVESAGTVPDGLTMFEVWQGAVWSAGAPGTPSVLYACRTGNILDWDFAVASTDLGGAFFTAGEDEGLLRGNVTAIIPHSTDTLLVGTTEGIIALYGHPRKGGIIEDFSSRRIVSSRAWCKGPDDTTYLITDEGLVSIAPGGQTGVVPVSQQKIPGALSLGTTALTTNLGTLTNMAYNRAFNGIQMYTASGKGFWFDLNTNSFWQMTYPNVLGMLEDAPISLDIDGTVVEYGSAGMHAFDDTLDATESVTATCFLGPVKLASSVLEKAMLQQARCVLDSKSGTTLTLDIGAGVSGQDAFARVIAGNAQYSRTVSVSTNANAIFYPRVTGNSAVVKLTAEASITPTIFEELAINIGPRQKNRNSGQAPGL